MLIASDCLLAPVLVLFAHAVDVVSHEVDRLSERVGASAKDLDGLSHEFDVTFCKALVTTIFHLVRSRLGLAETAISCGTLSATIALLSALLLFLSDSAHFDLRSSVLVHCRFVIVVIALVHHGFRLLYKLTLAFVLELRPLLELLTVIVILLSWLVVFDVPITDELLVALLLLHASLLLLHGAHLSRLFFLLALSLGLLFLDALLLLLFSSALGLLLLLATGFLFSALALLLGFRLGSLLLSSLSLHLLAHGLLLFGLGLCSTIIRRRATATSKNLLHVRGRVNARSGRSEHSLQERIGLFRLVTSDHLSRLHINLFANHELRKLDQLY